MRHMVLLGITEVNNDSLLNMHVKLRTEVRAVEIKLDSLPGSEVQVLRDKFQNVFGKNSGYKKMCKVAQVLEGVPVDEIYIPLFKYARLTSCDVERSFSQYKSLFRYNRHAFVMENLEMTFVVHCNSRPNTSTQVRLLDERILAVVCNGTKAASTQFNIPIAYACNLGRILKKSSLKDRTQVALFNDLVPTEITSVGGIESSQTAFKELRARIRHSITWHSPYNWEKLQKKPNQIMSPNKMRTTTSLSKMSHTGVSGDPYFLLPPLGAKKTTVPSDTRMFQDTTVHLCSYIWLEMADISQTDILSQSAVKNLKVKIYKTVILLVVLYGCETWTLTLREEQRWRFFENKVLRKIFGSKRDEVTGEWRKLRNTELHAFYSSPDIIRNIKSRRLRWAGHVAHMGESINAYSVLVGRPEGKRPLGRPRRRWEDIKMDLREVGYDDRDRIGLAQDRDQWRAYVRAAMNLRVP
ncbi:hypothetical protein ANN_21537 [Periplaneta americana]|uniref:Uncharacterized protein n=1 Tax=Periplaneta americana TaxID=6978 RepID=A0ABQ8S6A3_PERAM|nr:hypothetical protein ANN_21537 [Periplaneta americana]